MHRLCLQPCLPCQRRCNCSERRASPPHTSSFHRCKAAAADNGEVSSSGERSTQRSGLDADAPDAAFCIIESRDAVKDFARLQLAEINQGILKRRTRIFLLMEEVRRLRVQQRVKGGERHKEEEVREDVYPSVVPFLPPLTDATIRDYFTFYLSAVAAIITFGALLAPALELHLGMGGTSYEQFINSVHLPSQLAHVDPIVASFCGGAVGVLSTLMVVEANNSSIQASNRCIYCGGCGYVACGTCGGLGSTRHSAVEASTLSKDKSHPHPHPSNAEAQAAAEPANERCGSCSGTGKVMCISCLCTGKKVAKEHEPRLDPFS